MVRAYSRLKRVLGERKMTVPELHRHIRQRGMSINLKSLYRLSNEHQPLERLDLRVAGAICQVFGIQLSELITFEMRRLSAAKQRRLDALMAKNNDGWLTDTEREELRTLVREAEEITLNNARLLSEQNKRLTVR